MTESALKEDDAKGGVATSDNNGISRMTEATC